MRRIRHTHTRVTIKPKRSKLAWLYLFEIPIIQRFLGISIILIWIYSSLNGC